MRILISGATGLVGSALHHHLQGLGHEVIALRRNASGAAFSWQPEKGLIHLDPAVVIDGVINLSGANIGERRWSPARKQELLESRLRSTSLLAETVVNLSVPPQFFLSASAIGYYGESGTQSVDESSAPGTGFLADIGRQWEQAAAPAGEAGVRTVLMRTGVVLSPQGGALQKMLPAFRLGLGGVIGSGDQILSWVSLHELVVMISFLIDRSDLHGPINLVSPDPVSNREFTRTLGQVLHRPAWLPLPALAVKGMFGEMGQALLLSGSAVVPTRLLQSGYTFIDRDLTAALQVELGMQSL